MDQTGIVLDVLVQRRRDEQAARGGLAKPEDRHAVISRLCEQAGGKLVSLYFTLGQYDFMVVTEMPDAKAASIKQIKTIATRYMVAICSITHARQQPVLLIYCDLIRRRRN